MYASLPETTHASSDLTLPIIRQSAKSRQLQPAQDKQRQLPSPPASNGTMHLDVDDDVAGDVNDDAAYERHLELRKLLVWSDV